MKAGWITLLGLLLAQATVFPAGSVSVSQELDVDYSYVGGAGTRGAGARVGSVDEHSVDVRYVVSPQLSKDLLLRAGGEWQRFSFGVPNRAPIPGALQQASLILGCDYQVADDWIGRIEIQPGIYSDFRDISWRDFNAPLILGAVYLASSNLQWFFGLRLDARSQYPVLPAVGVRWEISDEWTLDFMLPKPRIEYDVNQRLQVYFGAALESGTFAVGEKFGSPRGQPKLDGAIVDFLEVRIGPGCSWKINHNLALEAEVGYMPYRSFDFFDPKIVFRSHDAPYGQIACHAKF